MNKIKVKRGTQIAGKTIFDVELDGNKFLIDDIFVELGTEKEFRLLGIGTDNNFDYMNKAILVEILNDKFKIEDFIGRVFVKKG